MRRGETQNEVDDAISEFGAGAVAAGLHRLGREPTELELTQANCDHEWVDEDDDALGLEVCCIQCGKVRR